MRKFCVFCGEKPVGKNKEHIIPQWLIKYTGDTTNLGNWIIGKLALCLGRFGKSEEWA